QPRQGRGQPGPGPTVRSHRPDRQGGRGPAGAHRRCPATVRPGRHRQAERRQAEVDRGGGRDPLRHRRHGQVQRPPLGPPDPTPEVLPMPTVILPVGLYLGPSYRFVTPPDPAPEYWEVRLGRESEELTVHEFEVWGRAFL